MNSFMEFDRTVDFISLIKKEFDIKTIDLGALEPFLYRSNGRDIVDLVEAIEKLDLEVKVTTNGSLLSKFADRLSSTKISKIRVSLHSINEQYFNKLTTSKKFIDVLESVKKAHDLGLPVELNCLMLKGFESEALDVVNFCNNNKINLKVHNLYYSPEYEESYNKYYLSGSEMVEYFSENLNFTEANILREEVRSRRDRVKIRVGSTDIIIKTALYTTI